MTATAQTREARAERLAHERSLNDRVARLAAQYERLEEGLKRIENQMALDGEIPVEPVPLEADAAAPVSSTAPRRRHRPRKPR